MNKQDWKDYVHYLNKEIKAEEKKEDSIPKFYNMNVLYTDLNDSKNEYRKL